MNTAIFFLNPEQGQKEMTLALKNEIAGVGSIEESYWNDGKVLQIFVAELFKNTNKID